MIPLSLRLVLPDAAEDLATRPLFTGAPAELPVAALVEDDELVTVDRLESLGLEADDAFEQALEEREPGAWTARRIPVKGAGELTIVVGGEAEDVLGAAGLLAAAAALGASTLAVAIPARGTALAMDAGAKWQLVAAFSSAARLQHGQAGDDALYAGVLRAAGGAVTGVIELTTASLDEAEARLRRS